MDNTKAKGLRSAGDSFSCLFMKEERSRAVSWPPFIPGVLLSMECVAVIKCYRLHRQLIHWYGFVARESHRPTQFLVAGCNSPAMGTATCNTSCPHHNMEPCHDGLSANRDVMQDNSQAVNMEKASACNRSISPLQGFLYVEFLVCFLLIGILP